MANRKMKKAIVFALVLTMLMPLGSAAAEEEEKAADAASETAAEKGGDEGEEKESAIKSKLAERITEDEALALCTSAASNDKFELLFDQKNDRWAVKDKKTGYVWWSSPINVLAEEDALVASKKKKMIASSAAVKAGSRENGSESAAQYSKDGRTKYSKENGGFKIAYSYTKGKAKGISFTAHVKLEEDCVYVYADASEVVEEDTSATSGIVLDRLQLAPAFGSVGITDEDGNPTKGYIIVPDGSGAVIEYNNKKAHYNEYEQRIYGRDFTPVSLNAPRVTEQAYLPVLASVSGKTGFVAIATDGEGNVIANAKSSGQDSQIYNSCWFEFEARSRDEFFMSGDNTNKMTVIEKGDIKTERFGVKFYPLVKDEDINYADCAEVYRNYLIKEKGLTKKTTENYDPFYVDFYGGVLKQTSILGIPFNLKTEITGFEQAGKIIDELNARGIKDTIVNYNDWTNKSIKHTVSTSASASGTLGGNGDFKDFLGKSGVNVFPTMDNFTMESSTWGYLTFSNTATRISNAYSRQVKYSPAFGVAVNGISPALIAPSTYVKIFDEMIESYKDEDIKNIGFGQLSYRLVSDYSKKNPSVRSTTMKTIVDGYEKANEEIGSVLCSSANSYVIPYASQITNVPVYSSGFNITDYDIPFYQMVVHGYVPYSTKPINASSNTGDMFMNAVAAGSGIHYDFTYEESSILQDTDYNDLYYTNYEGWLDLAARQYTIADLVLSEVSDMTISKYEVSPNKQILTTTYTKDGKNVVVTVDKSLAVVTIDGKTYDMASAIEGGAEGR